MLHDCFVQLMGAAGSDSGNQRLASGSTLVEEQHRDDGEGCGFDNVPISAMLNRRSTVDGGTG